MKNRNAFAVAVLTLLVTLTAKADGIGDALGISPHWDWKTLESEHFRVTFPKELDALARRSTKYLEEAHRLLEPELQWTPKTKTQILVVDNADAANGLTSAFQRFGILLILTPPDNWFSTSVYDDWMRLLCIHEYTHYLNMDPTHGIYEGGRILFGDVLLPNAILPPWMLEGLAVYYETKFTRGGRGRSTYFDAMTRTTVKADAFQKGSYISIDQINGPRPFFPGGETPYYYGWALNDELSKKHEKLLGSLSVNSSYRIPFFINGNLENTSKELTGVQTDWYKTWDEWVARVTASASQELKQLASQPLSPTTSLTPGAYTAMGARVSPDLQWIAYQQETLSQDNAVWVQSLTHGTKRKLVEKMFGSTFAFSPDSKTLFWSQAGRSDQYSMFSTLKAYDLENSEAYVLSTMNAQDLRARDPDVSPDGKQITFTWTKDATTGLGIATLDKNAKGHYELKDPKMLYWPKAFAVVSQPKFKAGGKSIVFSLHENGRNQEDLMEIAASEKTATEKSEAKTLVSDGAYNRFASVAPNGDIYYSSNRTGVDTIYRYAGAGASVMVANTDTALWFPSVTNERTAYASVLGINGWEVAKIELKPTGFDASKLTLSRIAPKKSEATKGEPIDTELSETKDYSVFPSIWPRQWAPLLFIGQDYSLIGGQILGFDAIDQHRYLFGGLYDTDVKRVNWLALYSNRSFGPTFTLFGYQTFAPISAGSANLENDLYVQASASFPNLFFNPSLETRFERTRFEYGYKGASPTIQNYDDVAHTLRFRSQSFNRPRLSLGAETGGLIEFGIRGYQSSYQNPFVGKGYLSLERAWTPFDEAMPHWTFHPALRGAISTKKKNVLSASNVQISGRYRSVFGELTQDKLDRFRLRGYPRVRVDTQSAVNFGNELTFPLAWIYRGWGTNPFFAENLSGMVFGEGVGFTQDKPLGESTMTSAGGGIRLATTLFVRIPLVFALELHHGFNDRLGGQTEGVGRIDLGAIGF